MCINSCIQRRRLADRLFGGQADARLDYSNVPSVVFFHPPLGAVGLTEAGARKRYGNDKIKGIMYAMWVCIRTAYACAGGGE